MTGGGEPRLTETWALPVPPELVAWTVNVLVPSVAKLPLTTPVEVLTESP